MASPSYFFSIVNIERECRDEKVFLKVEVFTVILSSPEIGLMQFSICSYPERVFSYRVNDVSLEIQF